MIHYKKDKVVNCSDCKFENLCKYTEASRKLTGLILETLEKSEIEGPFVVVVNCHMFLAKNTQRIIEP